MRIDHERARTAARRAMSLALSRREFLGVAGSAAVSIAAGRAVSSNATQLGPDPARLHARPGQPRELSEPGTHALRLGGERDGFYTVPRDHVAARSSPLLVLLHGATQSSALWSRPALESVLAKPGAIVLCPDSRAQTWDISLGGFGPDVEFLDRALASVFDRCLIDPKRIALAGFSDGASYSLSLGIANGDLFPTLMAFSPGFLAPSTPVGKPRVFISHGTSDAILPINAASRRIVPRLEQAGYDVDYHEFEGGHTVPPTMLEAALTWWLAGPAAKKG